MTICHEHLVRESIDHNKWIESIYFCDDVDVYSAKWKINFSG